ARDLRASLRASFSISCRACTAVLRLTLASLAISVGVASGVALSAARARSRASWRLYFRFRRAVLRGRRGRSARWRGSAAGGSGSGLRSSAIAGRLAKFFPPPCPWHQSLGRTRSEYRLAG